MVQKMAKSSPIPTFKGLEDGERRRYSHFLGHKRLTRTTRVKIVIISSRMAIMVTKTVTATKEKKKKI